MNDTTKEPYGKKSKTNNVVCVNLRLKESWNLVTLTFKCALLFYEFAKWRTQHAHVSYLPTRSTCSTCPRSLRAHVPKYILQTRKLKISVLMKSNESSLTDIFKDAEF